MTNASCPKNPPCECCRTGECGCGFESQCSCPPCYASDDGVDSTELTIGARYDLTFWFGDGLLTVEDAVVAAFQDGAYLVNAGHGVFVVKPADVISATEVA